jgi:type VI secretion system protein ImpL
MFTHFRDNLANYIDTSSSPWKSRRAEDGNVSLINGNVLRSFEAADQIRRISLDEQGKLRVSSIMRIMEMDPQLSEVVIDIGGQTLKYAHGVSTPKRFDWTSSASNLMIRVQFRAVDGRSEVITFNGPWALFKFFDNGYQSARDSDRRETQHRTSLGSVTIEWQSTVSPGPLWAGVFGSFRCP